MTDTTDELIDGREDVYGDPVVGMQRTALIWSGILGHHVRPDQVPLLLAGYKLMRASVTPTYSDNSDDVDGYLDIFRKTVGDNMIEARSVSEYQGILAHRAESEHLLQQSLQEDAARRDSSRLAELEAQNSQLRQMLQQELERARTDFAGRTSYEGP